MVAHWGPLEEKNKCILFEVTNSHYTYVCMCVGGYLYLHCLYLYGYIYVRVYIYTHIYIYMYIGVYICVYIHYRSKVWGHSDNFMFSMKTHTFILQFSAVTT